MEHFLSKNANPENIGRLVRDMADYADSVDIINQLPSSMKVAYIEV